MTGVEKKIFWLITGCILLTSTELFANEVCSFVFRDCPELFNGKMITVPRKVTSISSYIDACPIIKSVEEIGPADSSLSIIFVIDHSNSMLGEDIEIPRDKDGTRFLVTKSLIDTLQKRYPKAEVGLIIFREILFLDTKDNPLFVPLPEGYPYPGAESTQGYIPLIRLDSTFSNGKTGADFIRSILETRSVEVKDREGNPLSSTDLVYNPDFKRNGGTNINVAFDAAREAFSKTRNAKENQYIIFLSDGEANAKSGSMAVDDYVKGINLPTTFTIFFTPADKEQAPANIIKMTGNIRSNNYSKSNEKSNLWTIKTSFDTLLHIMMNNIMNKITPELVEIQQKPVSIQVNNRKFQPLSDSGSTFYTPDILLLDDTLSHFELNIDYQAISGTGSPLDTTVRISFDVLRTDERDLSEGIDLQCRDTILYDVSVVTVDPEASEAPNNSGSIEFRRNNGDDRLTVYFSVTGTASRGIDYQTISDSVVFEKGVKTVSLTIQPLADTLSEGDETVIITLNSSHEDRVLQYRCGLLSTGSVVIKDNYIEPEDTIRITVSHNPFYANKPMQIPFSTRSLYSDAIGNQNTGTIISVYSIRPLVPMPNTNIYGYGYIYDATGNLIKKLELKKANPNDTAYYGMVWNGTNSRNREVGTGIYLLKLKIRNISGIERGFREKIGVR